MPEISYEALAGAALLVVLAVGYQYIPKGALDGVAGSAAGGSGSGAKNKKKNKKKSKGGAGQSSAPGEAGKEETATSAEETDTPRPAAAGAGKGKGKKGKSSSSSNNTPTASQTFAKVAEEPNGSQEGELAPHQGQEQGRKPKTLAERLAPKPRKTKVDDMLAPEDRPATHARVMKIASQADSEKSTPRASSPSTIPAASAEAEQRNPITASISGSSSSSSAEQKVAKYEDDYQDEDGMTSTSNATEEDGWDVVSRKKKTISLNTSSDPFASNNYRPGSSPAAAAEAETKIQRKNAKKNEAKKAQKEAEEADRLARLAAHKKGLERERINEIYKSSQNKKNQTGKTNGGAFASLDTNGKLVWD